MSRSTPSTTRSHRPSRRKSTVKPRSSSSGLAPLGALTHRPLRALRPGSSASVSSSPSRFATTTVSITAAPGKMQIHHADTMYDRPSAIIVPQAGAGGGTPTPRKLSEASMMITSPDLQRCEHDQRTGDVRHDVLEHDSEPSCTRRSREIDVLELRDAQSLVARHARELRPQYQADDDHDVRQARPDEHADQQRDQDHRQRDREIDDAHQDGVEPSADVTGDDADRAADDGCPATASVATSSDTRAPYRNRLRMSRPSTSVPRR